MHSEPSERRRLQSGEQQSTARCAERSAVRRAQRGAQSAARCELARADACQPGVLEVRLPGWAQAGEVIDRRAAKTQKRRPLYTFLRGMRSTSSTTTTVSMTHTQQHRRDGAFGVSFGGMNAAAISSVVGRVCAYRASSAAAGSSSACRSSERASSNMRVFSMRRTSRGRVALCSSTSSTAAIGVCSRARASNLLGVKKGHFRKLRGCDA